MNKKISALILMGILAASSMGQDFNDQKRIDLSYTANFGKLTTLQWLSSHDMKRLDNMYDYHFRFQTNLATKVGRFSLFASEDGGCAWKPGDGYTSRNFGVSWQQQGPNFGLSITLMKQMRPWNAADSGLRLKIDLRSDFK